MLDSVILKPGKDVAVKHGHPWIFSGAIARTTGKITPGSTVLVLDAQEKPIGLGYHNNKSGITVRMLTRNPDAVINKQFFIERFQQLRALKESFLDTSVTNSYRVVFAESDGIPGLIVDKFNDVLVVQSHTAGIDEMKNWIVGALVSVFAPRAVYERSDLGVRKMEGLETQPTGLLYGTLEATEVEILENGMTFSVDVATGQKTGFFLDQRDNRQVAARYAKGKKCLNVFSYTGGFGVAMLKGGAEQVINVDSSEGALTQARKNYELNDLEVIEDDFVCADAFDALAAAKTGDFDVILLDPPAFTKSVKEATQALKAYTKLNSVAMRKLDKGGILMTSSCSGAVTEDAFMRAIQLAASQSESTMRLVEKRSQPIDHAVNTSFPEGNYLKFMVFVKE